MHYKHVTFAYHFLNSQVYSKQNAFLKLNANIMNFRKDILPKVKDSFKEAVMGTTEFQKLDELGSEISKIGVKLRLDKFKKTVQISNIRVRNTLDCMLKAEKEDMYPIDAE